jgi:hypothetical protein
MAILAGGRIVLKGRPDELVATMRGRVWKKTVKKAELESLRQEREVIASRLFAGDTLVHVLADADPGDGFAPVTGDLEDLYFATLATRRHAA